MELITVLAIIAVLIALALPRYIIPRRNAYKEEALNLLQEIKTMEWGYYQEYNAFTNNILSLGYGMPSGAHWATPVLFTFTPAYVVFGTYGTIAPMKFTDVVMVTLSGDGSSSVSSTF